MTATISPRGKNTDIEESPPPGGADALAVLKMIPISQIRPWEGNPRQTMDDGKLDSLAESIRLRGVLSPITVRPFGNPMSALYQIVAGERRWRAAERAGLQEIPCSVRPGLSDRESLEFAITENDQREDVKPLERARGYQRLRDQGDKKLTLAEVAVAVNRGLSTVASFIDLLDLPADVQELIDSETLTVGHAKALRRWSPWPKVTSWLAARIVEEKVSTHMLETGNLPVAWVIELQAQGHLKRLFTSAPFDISACKSCALKALRENPNGDMLCLRPDHYAELAAAGLAAKESATQAEEVKPDVWLPRMEAGTRVEFTQGGVDLQGSVAYVSYQGDYTGRPTDMLRVQVSEEDTRVVRVIDAHVATAAPAPDKEDLTALLPEVAAALDAEASAGDDEDASADAPDASAPLLLADLRIGHLLESNSGDRYRVTQITPVKCQLLELAPGGEALLWFEGELAKEGMRIVGFDDPQIAAAVAADPHRPDTSGLLRTQTPDEMIPRAQEALREAHLETVYDKAPEDSAPVMETAPIIDSRAASLPPSPKEASVNRASTAPTPSAASETAASLPMTSCLIPTVLDDWLFEIGFDNVTEALELLRRVHTLAEINNMTLQQYITMLEGHPAFMILPSTTFETLEFMAQEHNEKAKSPLTNSIEQTYLAKRYGEMSVTPLQMVEAMILTRGRVKNLDPTVRKDEK